MKSNNYTRLFLGLACASVLMMSACKKDLPAGEYSAPSAAQDKATLTDATSSLGEAAGEIVASPGAGAVASFGSVVTKISFGKTDGFLHRQIMNRLMAVFTVSKRVTTTRSNAYKTATTDEPSFPSVSLDYDSHTGIYTYDPNGGEDGHGGFSFSRGGSRIVVNFPADTANKYNNNGTLTISSFSEVKVADSLFLPSNIVADLKVNNQILATLKFSASYSSNGLPEELSLVLWVKPFTLTVKLSNQSTVTTGSLSLIEDGASEPIIAFGATLRFADATRSKLNAIDNAYIQVKGLKIAGSANLVALGDDPTSQQLNDNIDVTITVNGSKVGELEFDETSTDKTAVIRFNDGTTEPASGYFDNITAMGDGQ